jgi:glucan 1,3-beta-glucosidase
MFTEYMSPDKVFVIHDSFRSTIWENFELSENTKNITILMDTHQYTAWNSQYSSYENLIKSSRGWQAPYSTYKYVIGEWSLAIDNCEMWLNGFMDNVPGYPLFECSYRVCPKNDQFKYELSQSMFGPFGTGLSYPRQNIYNKNYECPVSISLSKHFPNVEIQDENQEDKQEDKKEDKLAEQLFLSKTRAFEKETAGWIFWNFRTESLSYQWNYLAYLKLINGDADTDTDAETNSSPSVEYYNKNNYTISIFILICIVIFSLVMYFVYLYKNYLYKTTKYTGYVGINSTQFENKNYQSISI